MNDDGGTPGLVLLASLTKDALSIEDAACCNASKSSWVASDTCTNPSLKE